MRGSEGGSGPIRVLLVDDEEQLATVTARQLERHAGEIEVVTAASAEAGLERITGDRVDCVVSDYRMPEMDGLEFLEAIREVAGDVPYILYTGQGSEAVASDAISAGVTDYLLKEPGPEQYDLLANRIRNAVESARTARKLEERREWFEGLIEHSLDLIVVIDDERRITYASPSAERILGHEPAEMVGERVLEYIHPEDREPAAARLDQIAGDGDETIRGEGRIRHADGSWRWIEVLASDRTDTAIGGYVVNARDVTGKKRRERILQELHGVARDLMAAESREEIVEIVTDAAEDVFGFPLAAVRLLEDGRLVPAGHTREGDEFVARGRSRELPAYEPGEGPIGGAFERGEPVIVDDLSETAAGDRYDRLESGICLPLGEYGTLTVGAREPAAFSEEDVELGDLLATEATAALERAERERALRDREAELQRQNERLDQFASVVSHDLRNPIEAGYGHLELAATECDSEHLAGVREMFDRMDELIEDALALARQGEAYVDPTVIDPSRVANTAWETTVRADATLAVEDDLGSIRADENQLQQLFENLFRNSVEHGGEDVTVRVGPLDGGFFVADEGPGLPETGERLFEVGYSTADGGVGLGLSIVRGVAETHGWSVEASDSAAGGARFEFTGVEEV